MTHTGRRRTFPVEPPHDSSEEEQDRYRKDVSSVKRISTNMLVQSLGSDVTLMQASRVQRWIEANNLQDHVKIFNLVHDSIWVYIRRSYVWVVDEIKRIMEDLTHFRFKLDVPLTVEYNIGLSLAESMGTDETKEIEAQRRQELGFAVAA